MNRKARAAAWVLGILLGVLFVAAAIYAVVGLVYIWALVEFFIFMLEMIALAP